MVLLAKQGLGLDAAGARSGLVVQRVCSGCRSLEVFKLEDWAVLKLALPCSFGASNDGMSHVVPRVCSVCTNYNYGFRFRCSVDAVGSS